MRKIYRHVPMTMAAKLLNCCKGERDGEVYKRMAVLGESRRQRITTTSHLSRLSLSYRPYNHASDPFNLPLFRVH